MRVLFIGEGLADYTVNILNKLQAQSGVEVFDLVDSGGFGHVPPGVRQTREGVTFSIVELTGIVAQKYTDYSYWSFMGLPKKLQEIRPDIILVSFKYARMFLHDTALQMTMRVLGSKLILNDNPYRMEPYREVMDAIIAGHKDDTYTPWYVLYLLSLCEKLGVQNIEQVRKRIIAILQCVRLQSTYKSRNVLRYRVDELKHLLAGMDAALSYNDIGYDIYPTYGMPREKIFIKYNSPDTDLVFAAREKIEHEAPILPPNPHRFIHVGRLAP